MNSLNHYALQVTFQQRIDVGTSQFIEFLRKKGYPVTSQRLAVLNAALRSDGPVNADRIFGRAREQESELSLSTVHRTLQLLTESGVLAVVGSPRDFKLYHLNSVDLRHHSHILCVDCGKTFAFATEGKVSAAERNALSKSGFSFEFKQTQIKATCHQLRKSGKCTRIAR